MTIEEILAGESKQVEFKERRSADRAKYMKTVIAFANGQGGTLVFGVSDRDRQVIGISKDSVFQEIDAITNAISDSCVPTIIPDVYLQTIQKKTVIVVEITAGKQKPYYLKSAGVTDGVYVRVAGTTRKADRMMTEELYYAAEGRSYDALIRPDIAISEEDIAALCAGLEDVARKNCANDEQRKHVKKVTKNALFSWGILAEENGKLYPTNAYELLRGAGPSIQCGLFKGNTRAVFIDKREYTGNLWEQVEGAFQFVLRNIRLGAVIEDVYRKDMYELPPASIREVLLNAVMNCSYIQKTSIQVAVFDNRLEITSPGGVMPSVTIERMKEGYSQIRNKALARVFSYLNLIEAWGTGIPRLYQELREYGLPEPEIVDMETALRVCIYRSQERMQDSAEEVPKKCRRSAEEVPKNFMQIMDAVRAAGSIRTPDVMTLLEVKERRAREVLRQMVDSGYLKRLGATSQTRYVPDEKARTFAESAGCGG